MILRLEQNAAQSDIEIVITYPVKNKNGDEELNTGAFGLPSEPVGKTNYNLRGSPGNFNKLKVAVNKSSTKLIVNMGKVRLL